MGTGRVRWGILSTAKIAQEEVIPAMKRANNAEVAAIASLSGKARGVAERFHIPTAYETYEELLVDPNIDAVYIPLPNSMHKEWVIKAALSGKHILCEKPVALTAEDASEMGEACRERGVLLMEAFMYQFHPQHQRVREIISSGEIGEVKFMRAAFTFMLEGDPGNIRLNRELGGGSVYDVGCYCIHSIRNVLKTEPVTVLAWGEFDPIHQVDVSASVICQLENGVRAMFDCGMNMVQRHQYEIVGTKGSIEVPRAFRPDLYNGEGLIIVTNRVGRQREERVIGHQYTLEIEHFSQCVLEGKQPVYSMENSFHNMRVIDACYRSMREGKIVGV